MPGSLRMPLGLAASSMTSASLRHWATLVFVLSCIAVAWGMFRPEPPAQVFSNSDKVAHLAAFFVLALSGRLAFPRLPEPAFWLGFLFLALGLEYLQGAVRPLRLFSLADAGANALGTALAAAAWFWARASIFSRE